MICVNKVSPIRTQKEYNNAKNERDKMRFVLSHYNFISVLEEMWLLFLRI